MPVVHWWKHLHLRSAAQGVSRLALVILALSLVLPLLPLDRDATFVVAKILLVATIVLIGWIALIAIDVAAKLYLLRFRLDAILAWNEPVR